MRITLDTNVLVRAAVAPQGPGRAVLGLGTAPPHVIVISDFIIAELRRALGYPRIRQRYAITDGDVDEFESLLRGVADTVPVPAQMPVLSGDPDDDPIIATAVIGQSDVLCTLDRHLRQPLIEAYCATFNIRVLTDVELLAELRAAANP
jgi:putative PIN family toxin of toxin-antitoxin system